MTPVIRNYFFSLFMREDPTYALQVAHSMVDYELPAGFQEQSAMQIKTYYSIAILALVDHPADLIIFQTASDLMKDPEYGPGSQERAAQEIVDLRYQTHTVDVHDISISGHPSEMRIMEGTDDNGIVVRQALTVFPGRNGNVMLIIIGDIETWDQGLVNRFIASIR